MSRFMMWCPLFLVLLAGAVSAEHFHAWKTDTEYQYLVRGRTLAALHDVADQYSGIILKAQLTVRPKSAEMLEAKVSKARYGRIHTTLLDGWKTEVSDDMVEFMQLPMTEKVFEVKMKHGVVRDVMVDHDVPTWEVNMLKSFMSQLQIDTQGENMMPSRYNLEPEEDRYNAMYKTMEDSVGGKCEVLYDINPLSEMAMHYNHEWMPMIELRGNDEMIDIVKTKNYTNCEQRMSYHFGVSGSARWEPATNDKSKTMSRSSISRIIITGNLKTFTIQSSVTNDKVVLSPLLHQRQKGMVGSMVNVTLVKMGSVSPGAWVTPANPESMGNLVYTFNEPFPETGEDRRPMRPVETDDSNERLRHVDYRSEDWGMSDLSKDTDSMESDEKLSWYMQPKPTMNKAPSTPLLPMFVGYHGKSIHKSEVDPVTYGKKLTREIGTDLQNPNSITDEQTMEKFTILTSLLRTMNTEQLADMQRELFMSPNELGSQEKGVLYTTWIAFRDALVQAGTGPALVTIKNMIKEKKLKGMEAAAVVGPLSKSARAPTPEYMDTFFKMATMPETVEEEHLNTTAIITFADLIRSSQIDENNIHGHYPVHTFGRLSPKMNPAVFRDYVPYMATHMKDALEKKESAKALVFIRAVGNVGHPKILGMFEPYLEGKLPATTFQRLMMVFSLNKLAMINPRLARDVLYKIYQNTAEAHQLRCAAVTLLMTTNPPESMLQRMAEFTNYDLSKHVSAAVKSAIMSASELTRPEVQDFATKARNVRSLVTNEEFADTYSTNWLIDYVLKELNIATRMNIAQIGSKDSMVPQALWTSVQMIYGDFKAPEMEIGAMVSSVSDIYDTLMRQFFKEREHNESEDKLEGSPWKIAEMLKMKTKFTDDLEGAFWMNSKNENQMLTFDKETIRRIPNFAMKALESLKNGKKFNAAWIDGYDLTMSFPLESGIPFVYTLKIPNLIKLSGEVKGSASSEKVEGFMDLRLVYAMQVQGKLGFITPFEHQHYMAGENKNYQIQLPIRAEVKFEQSADRLTTKLWKLDRNEETKVLQIKVVPFTSRHDISSLTPTTTDKETHMLTTEKAEKVSGSAEDESLAIKWEVEAHPSRSEDSGKNSFERLANVLFDEKIKYRSTEIKVVQREPSSRPLVLTASFKTLSKPFVKNNSEKKEHLDAWDFDMKNKKLNDIERSKKLLNEVVKGINGADGFVVDLGIDMPGHRINQLNVTFAYADSKVDKHSRGLMYAHAESEMSGEACATMESESPEYSTMHEALENDSTKHRKFDIEIRAGQTCKDGKKIQISGEQKQTGGYRRMIKKEPEMARCNKEAQEHQTTSPSCQHIRRKLLALDESKLVIKLDPELSGMKRMMSELADFSSSFENVDVMRQYRDIEKNTVELSLNLDPLHPNGKVAEFLYDTPEVAMSISDVEIGPVAAFLTNVDPELTMSDRLEMDIDEMNHLEQGCVIGSGRASTFDRMTYPMELGKCWHVAFTTMPKMSKEAGEEHATWDRIFLREISVLVKDTNENKEKEILITFDKTEIKMKKVSGKIHVMLDNKEIPLDEERIHRMEKPTLELIKRSDGSVKLDSDDINLSFDGDHVRIEAAAQYRDNIRGLCGNYDGEPADDLSSPKYCLMMKPEEFVASYALTSKNCEGPALELSKKAEQADCRHETIRPANVVSDSAAGRKMSEQNHWGYHSRKHDESKYDKLREHKRCTTVRTKVIEEKDQTCFSLRPLPTCASGCKASHTKLKTMPMYCMPKGTAAENMASRIKQGAIPDLSQKELSKKLEFDLPVTCHVA